MNYLICISYNGFNLFGSQSQLNFFTVQDNIGFVLFKFSKKIFKNFFSSRTDKCVNSICQYLQIFYKNFLIKKKIFFLNFILNNIYILSIQQISKSFHTIYSALNRTYSYVFNFSRNFFNLFYLKFSINLYKLLYFFQNILGVKNFHFLNIDKKKINFIRIIYEFNFYKKDNFLYFNVKGNSFLYNMVRNIITCFLYIIYNYYNLFFIQFLYLKFFFFPISACSLFLISINY